VALQLSLVASGTEQPRRIHRPEDLKHRGYEQIELRRSGENRLFLFGKLDGHKCSVLVDTGWSYTTISCNAAERLKSHAPLELQPEEAIPTADPRHPAMIMSNLKLGRVTFTRQPVFVQDLVFNGQRAPFDVVVGCDFLIRNSAVIDCAKRRLYTRRGGRSPEQQAEFENGLQEERYLPVVIRRTNPLALSCPARLNGKPVELLVDTGAVSSCLDTDLAKSLGLNLLPTPRQITGAGAAGKRGFEVAKVDTVELGNAAMRSLNFAVLDLGDWGLAAPDSVLAGVRGILGGPELAECSAIIDCQALKLWWKPPTARR